MGFKVTLAGVLDQRTLRCCGRSLVASDESRSFERQHHLVNRRRADAKIFLHVGFGRRSAVQTRVEVDKRQILTLLGREVFCRVTYAGHPIQLFVRASHEEEAWMNVRYRVELSQTERSELTALLSGGKHAVRKLKRAQILLAADAGASDDDIATSVGVGGSTVYRTKQRFVLGNLEAALSEEPRPGARRKLSGKDEALLVATACSKPPGAAPVGPWNYWRMNWSSSPPTTVSPARPCAGGWPKTTSSPGARTCGAFRRSMANTSPAWRMCSTSMPKHPIRSTRSSASTRARPNSSARSASRSWPSQCDWLFVDFELGWRTITRTRTVDRFDYSLRIDRAFP